MAALRSSLVATALLAAACVSEPDYTGRLCSDLDPCPEGWQCSANETCVVEGTAADAGAPSDAEVADATPSDAGLTDAGPAPDAGGLDAASPDAASADSGPDAGPADAGDPRRARCDDPIVYPGQGWQVRYYDLPNLPDPSFGSCLAVDDVAGASLDQLFGVTEGPAEGVVDFGAIWTARRTFEAGVYTLVMDHDDGIRVYVDGQLLYEAWAHGRQSQVAFRTPYMTAGAHDIRIEHFDDDGEALIRFGGERGCTRLEAPSAGWIVSYVEITATEQLVMEHCYGVETLPGPGIDVDHGLSAPGPVAAQGVDDDFAIIAKARRIFGGETRFDALFDDGMRIWVDGALVLDEWEDGTTRSRRAYLHAVGPREVEVIKYDEANQSRLRLTFDTVCNLPPTNTGGLWFATYYPVTYSAAGPSWDLDRTDCLGAEVINTNGLSWGTIPTIVSAAGYTELWGAEYFGNRTFSLSTTVNVTHDDGLRVWSGSSLFYESWTAPQVITSSFVIPPGNHDLRLEYFENLGGEQLQFGW